MTPSLQEWRLLTAALDRVSDSVALGAEIDRVERECEAWPDALRLVPGRWMRDAMDGRPQPRLRVARALDLVLHDLDVPGDRGAWADAPALAHLTHLRVLDARLVDDGLRRWLDSDGHERVRDLGLGSGITAKGAERLASDSRLTGLTNLALFRNAIGNDGVAAILASPHLGSRLERLLLGRNGLDAASAAALAGPTSITGLDLLDLDGNRVESTAIAALSTAPLLEGVRVLNLSNNPIGRGGCEALAESPRLGRLDVLYLHGCSLTDDDVAPLLAAPWLARLSNLALSENELSLASVRALVRRDDLTLTDLDICHNRFAEGEADALLGTAPQFGDMRWLCT